ncbi:MAG: sodium:solute symporter family protein, partial [Spirochaetales bacterium]|nr:sodium:solute symporter family protein [Spirochaetales bacterium]
MTATTWPRLGIVLAYLAATLVIGLLFRRQSSASREEFFLAGRSVRRLLLFFTMSATNFSAFTIFGLSGAGYRIGYAFYPIMGFGTGFMALGFWIIGSRIHSLSRERSYVTPSDFVADRYGSSGLKRLFSGVMILFTLPYIAIQAIASGTSLNSLVGIPYFAGAALIMGFVIVYVSLGGMRSIVWTDLVQALMMIGFTAAAYVLIVRGSGGFVPAHREAYQAFPELFRRPGQDGSMLVGVWFGYLLLWFFADPMFPQLFQRFLAARDRRALATTMTLYPLITTGLFFLTVSIGVLGRVTFPALAPGDTDAVYPLLLRRYAGVFVSTLLLTGSLAALMSTLDSQLLTVSSMISLDFFRIRRREVLKEKLVVVVLGLLGLAIAARPPQTILEFINRTTFNGLAVLAPTVIGGLYWRRANRFGAAASILVGEVLVAAFYFGWLRAPGVLPVVPILGATAAAFVVVSALTGRAAAHGAERPELVKPVSRRSL